jgi:hypothetical protein
MHKTVSVVMDDAERNALVSTLVGAYDLERLAAAACRRADIAGREEQLAYCLVVIAQKQHGGSYGLRPDATDLQPRLAAAADAVAGHLRDWAPVHERIQEEFDRHEVATLRAYIQPSRDDDVIDRTADDLAAVIAAGPRPSEMTLDLARDEPPASNEYVFQSPLEAWIRLAASHRAPRDSDPYDERRHETPGARAPDEVLEDVARRNQELLRETVVAVSKLLETRALLAELIERAVGYDRGVERMLPASPTHKALLVSLRAAINDEADRLRHEQRALGDMLAYIVLAMRTAEKFQATTILSLRSVSIERAAVESMIELMRAAVTDERQPTPMLRARTHAARERGVSRNRSSALEALRNVPDRRGELLAGVAALLDSLPSSVADNAAIAAATGSKLRTVNVNRSEALKELRAVDHWFGRVFHRYAAQTG